MITDSNHHTLFPSKHFYKCLKQLKIGNGLDKNSSMKSRNILVEYKRTTIANHTFLLILNEFYGNANVASAIEMVIQWHMALRKWQACDC